MPEGRTAFVDGGGVPRPGEKRAARAAFPGGDLPEAPVGKGASLSRYRRGGTEDTIRRAERAGKPIEVR